MNKYRIGKSLGITMPVKTNGELVSLEGRDISVELVQPNGCRIEISELTISGSNLSFKYQGTQQKYCGEYTIIVWENKGLNGQTVVDKSAFELVHKSSEESGTDSGLDVEETTLTSVEISTGITGKDGKSAYELAVENGYSGTEAEWLASLKGDKGDKGDTGDKGEQGEKGDKGDKGDPGATDYNDLTNKPTIPTKTSELTNDSDFTTSSELAKKQDELTFDTKPKESSKNPVTSGGIKNALDDKQDKLTFDTTPTSSSTNPVTSGGVKTALDGKLDSSDAVNIADYMNSRSQMPIDKKLYYYDGGDTTLPIECKAVIYDGKGYLIACYGYNEGKAIEYIVFEYADTYWKFYEDYTSVTVPSWVAEPFANTTKYYYNLWELTGAKGEIDNTKPYLLRAKVEKDEDDILDSIQTANSYAVRIDCFYHNPTDVRKGYFYSLIDTSNSNLIGYVNALDEKLYDPSFSEVEELSKMTYSQWITTCREVFNEDLEDKIDAKVDKVDGKGLSTNDYTNAEKTQLSTNTSAISDLALEINGKADKVGVSEETVTTIESLTPNILHKWGEVASLTITGFTAGEDGKYTEYMIEFVSGETATTLSLPETITWMGGSAPTIAASKTYQISIVNNLAVIGEF